VNDAPCRGNPAPRRVLEFSEVDLLPRGAQHVGLMNILTVVSADVDEGRAGELVVGFASLLAGDLPDGLLETRLLGDGQGHWAIHSLWRDRPALDAMRASGEPAAPAFFRRFQAEPKLSVMHVVVDSAGRA